MRLAVWLIAAAAAGCAQHPLSDKVSTHAADGNGPAKVETLMRVASATEQSGDIATASTFYRRAYEANLHLGRKDAAPLIGLGRTLLALGAHNEASETFRTALDIAPDEPAALRGLGNALIAMDQPIAAVTNLEAALAKAPDVQTYSSLGVAYDLLDQRKSAQAAYRKGLALDPSNIALRNNLGLSLAFSGDFDESIVTLERVAADPRATLRQKLNLALAYGLAGDFEVAEQVLSHYLDASAVANNLAYYKTLRALQDKKLAARSVGVHAAAPSGAGQAEPEPNPAPPPSAVPVAPRAVVSAVAPPEPSADTALVEISPTAEPATGKPVDLVPPSIGEVQALPSTRDPGQSTVETSHRSPTRSMGEGRDDGAARASSSDVRQDPTPSRVRLTRTNAPEPLAAAQSTRRPAAGGAAQVQFAAFRSKEQAEESWRRLVAAAPELLAGVTASIEEGLSGADPNPYFRVRSAPFATRAEAADLCARLKDRKVDCMIVRGPPKVH